MKKKALFHCVARPVLAWVVAKQMFSDARESWPKAAAKTG